MQLYHELRSPLGLIQTTAQCAIEDGDVEAAQRSLDRIARVAERTLRVTESVLAMAGSERRTGATRNRTFSVEEPLSALVDDFAACVGRRINLDVEADAGELILRGSSSDFEAMTQALLTNAIDHGSDDSAIDVALLSVGESVAIEIRNPVAAVDTHRGLGIGTHLAGRLASALGGRLTLDREEHGAFVARFVAPLASAGADDNDDPAVRALRAL